MKLFTQKIFYFILKIYRLKRFIIIYPKSKDGYTSVDRKTMLDFNKIRFHGAFRLVCYNPFNNLFFNSRGQVVACCRSQKTVLGSYPKESIDAIWHGKTLNTLREHIKHNDFSYGCQYCDHQLKTSRFLGLPSSCNDLYATTKTKYPKILELELSNKCNLQCVMCSGLVSSSIREKREKIEPLPQIYDDAFFEQLKKYLQHAKIIKFYGGEPFLIDIYYKIWDYLIDIKSTANLHVVTNGTIFNDKMRQYFKKLNFTVTVSFDATDPNLFESIRKGANFQQVVSYIEEYIKILNHTSISLSFTPMQLNCYELPKVIDYCNQIGALINLSFMENPKQLALWTLSSDKLEELINYYKSYIFNKISSEHAQYNFDCYKEFIDQITIYKEVNRKRENDNKSQLVSIEECKIIIKTFCEKIQEKTSIELTIKDNIYDIIEDFINVNIPTEQQHNFYNILSQFIIKQGDEIIKEYNFDNIDKHILTNMLKELYDNNTTTNNATYLTLIK